MALKRKVHLLRVLLMRIVKRMGFGEPPEVVVVSGGGVATTLLCKHLGLFVKVNSCSDLDGLKHLPSPNSAALGSAKVIFVVGNPVEQVSSLSRRGLARAQLFKLRELGALFVQTRNVQPLLHRAILDQQSRFDSFSGPILRVNYDSLFERHEEIARFVGVTDPRFSANFPRRSNRS